MIQNQHDDKASLQTVSMFRPRWAQAQLTANQEPQSATSTEHEAMYPLTHPEEGDPAKNGTQASLPQPSSTP